MTGPASRGAPALLAGLALGLALALPAPAAFAGDVRVEFTEAPAPGAVLRGRVLLEASASTAVSFLRSFSLSIVSDDPDIPPFNYSVRHPADRDRWELGDAKRDDTIQLVWETSALTRYNGRYTVVAEAASIVDGESGAASATISGLVVDNPPVPPKGLEVALQESAPVLTWTRNPEPDVRRYRVLRSDAGRPPIQIAEAGETSYRDSAAPQGVDFSYRVVAVRASRVSRTGLASAPSDPSGALAIPAPPPGATQPATLPPPPVPAPPPLPTLKPRTVAPPRPGPAFSPLLPYQTPLPAPAAGEAEEAEEGDPQAGAASAAPGGTPDKTPFLAGAAMLLVASLHLARAARRLVAG